MGCAEFTLLSVCAFITVAHCCRIFSEHGDRLLWERISWAAIPVFILVRMVIEVYRQPQLYDPEETCVACLEAKPNARFSCGHACMCMTCTEQGQMNKCPVCSASLKWARRM